MSKDFNSLGPEVGGTGYGSTSTTRAGYVGNPPPGAMALPGMTNQEPTLTTPSAAERPTNTEATAPMMEAPPAYDAISHPQQGNFPPHGAYTNPAGGYPQAQPVPVLAYPHPQGAGYPPPGAAGAYQTAVYPQPAALEQGASTSSKGPLLATTNQIAPASVVVLDQPTSSSGVHQPLHMPPRPWSHGFCSCCNNINTLLLGWCCPCYVMGKNAEHLNESFCTFCCCSLMPIFHIVLQTILRGKIRNKREIPGSVIGDCCAVFFCRCCALIQEANEIATMKEEDAIMEIQRQ